MKNIKEMLLRHPFTSDLPTDIVEKMVEGALMITMDARQMLFESGHDAGYFFLVEGGRVSLEIQLPSHGPLTIQQIGKGEVLGWSWFFQNGRWRFDARTIEKTRVIALDAQHLRRLINSDQRAASLLLEKITKILATRLQATRDKLLAAHNIFPDPDDRDSGWKQQLDQDSNILFQS